MEIYYQWYKWAYSHQVWLKVAKKYNINEENIIWLFSFKDMFDKVVKNNGIWIVPIENSYAGSVYENFKNLVNYNVKIIWEYYLEISHCLLSTSKDKKTIKKAYSHYQALMQCEKYLKKNNIEGIAFWDTAGSAKYVKEQNNNEIASISSELAAKIYWLNILEKWINDQKNNTTRFFIISRKDNNIENFSKDKKYSIVFKTKDIPAVLYKCLWAFATNNINLTKIESIPTKEKQFEYMFWLDFEDIKDKNKIDNALNELWFFAKDIKILWNY